MPGKGQNAPYSPHLRQYCQFDVSPFAIIIPWKRRRTELVFVGIRFTLHKVTRLILHSQCVRNQFYVHERDTTSVYTVCVCQFATKRHATVAV